MKKGESPSDERADLGAQAARCGAILLNLSLAAVIFCALSLVSAILLGLIFLFGFILIILSLGIVFAVIPDYWQKLLGMAEIMGSVSGALALAAPYICPAAAVCALLGAILLCLDRYKRHTVRVVVAVITFLAAAALTVLFIGGMA